MNRKLCNLFVLALSFLLICSGAPAMAKVSSITDMSIPVPRYGTSTKLPNTERIISLANGGMEVLYALGVDRYVVGRDIASTFKGVEKIPVVTSGHAISAEKILKLKPTLMLVSESSGPAKALRLIKKSGVRVVVIPEAYSVAKMSEKYEAILRAISLNPENPSAQDLLSDIPVSSSTDSSSGVRVAFFYLRGTSSIYLMGGKGSGADDLIAAAGGIDVGADMGLPAFSPITSEAVIRSNPSILLLMEKGLKSVGGARGLRTLPGIAQTPAGQATNIITVDDSLLLSYGPRTSRLIMELRKILAKNVKIQG